MSSYFITGAAGFIASRVAELLLCQGNSVNGIDNLSSFYNPQMKLRRVEALKKHAAFQFIEGDIEDPTLLRNAADTGDYDAVIHLAARPGVRPSVQNPAAYLKTNILGTLNVLDLCRDKGIAKLVSASSSSVYGSNTTPFHEDDDTNQPLSPYAASKKAGEELCFTYHHLYNIDISVLRFFTVYGPAGRPDMSMFRFIRAIVEGQPVTVFGNGSQLRDFSYVDDIAQGVIASLKPCSYRVFNLGADSPVKLSRVIAVIEQLSRAKAAIQYQAADCSDVPATWADVSRAKTELGWQPSIFLEEGTGETLKWYLRNRDWARSI
jgi:UDP-glucuronate 4-epimerase